MSQIFTETIARAISDYRSLLRRHLKQPERRKKLAELNLKDSTLFESAERLYVVAWSIVKDIETSVDQPTGYYAYSGMAEFGKFLREYLSEYELEDGRLLHLAQKASKEIIKAIQYMSTSDERFTSDVVVGLNRCSRVVLSCGSQEQRDLYESALERQFLLRRALFTPVYNYFQSLLEDEAAVGTGGNSSVVDGGFLFSKRATG